VRKSTGLTHHCLWTPPRYGSSRRLVRYCSAATASRIGLNRELSTVLRSLDAPLAVHDPEVLLNLAISVGIGGDCAWPISSSSEPSPRCLISGIRSA
jgi:hypothetical protein